MRKRKPKWTCESEADFWERTAVVGECWEWQGSRHPFGYGYASWEGRSIGAHRLAYIFANGPIPKGMQVCHACDNPPCCNPDHLWLGTQADNNADRDRKGRGVVFSRRGEGLKGEASPAHKLSDQLVRAIRSPQFRPLSAITLAKMLQVGQTTILSVRRRESWKHIDTEGEDSIWLTVTEAACYLGVTANAVSDKIERGTLRATKVDRLWWIRRTDVEAYKEARQTAT